MCKTSIACSLMRYADDVGQARYTNSHVPPSRPSRPRREMSQGSNGFVELKYGRLRKLWRMLGEIILMCFQVLSAAIFGRPVSILIKAQQE